MMRGRGGREERELCVCIGLLYDELCALMGARLILRAEILCGRMPIFGYVSDEREREWSPG